MDEDSIPDTRVFVSGLPVHYTSEQLGAHFARRYQITDAVVIPNRRIGFVGFRNYTLATNAVKYFDKSYVRMSKISVELAKPVDFQRQLQRDSEPATVAQDAQKVNSIQVARQKSTPEFTSDQSHMVKDSKKRKRTEDEDQDAKKRDYTELMQPKSKPTWANGEPLLQAEKTKASGGNKATGRKDVVSEEKKMSAAKDNEPGADAEVTSEAERKRRKKEKKERRTLREIKANTDGETRTVEEKDAKKKRKAEKKLKKLRSDSHDAEGGVEPLNDDAYGAEDAETDIPQPEEPPRSDNDWLRGKTSRLLDLLDPDEEKHIQEDTQNRKTTEVIDSSDEDEEVENSEEFEKQAEQSIGTDISTAKTLTVHNGRLFVRNLPFSTTESDLRATFSRFGDILEAHISKDFKSSSSKGMAFVQFADSDAAISALRTLDGKNFQGRLLHILPASDKKASQLDEFSLSKLPLKKQKAIKQKRDAAKASFSWNSLYMNPDAVLASVADRLGVSKSEVLNPTSSDAAVKQALAETNTIKDTKTDLQNNGVNIEAFTNRRRDDRTLLLKNFSFGITTGELRSLLEPFGAITKLVLPITGTMAIAQYEDANMTSKALKHLAYRNLKGSVLYLEKAPEGIFDAVQVAKTTEGNPGGSPDGPSTHNLALDAAEHTSATVFVRNLNFATTSARLTEVFKSFPGYLNATVKTRTDPKRPGEILSMGFGFIEFKNKDHAAAAILAMNGYTLDGHELLVKASTKVLDAAEETRKVDKAKKDQKKTKIIIKNLPFEASKKDIRALFGTYGQLRSVRVPRKFDNSTRGFAFADFVNAKEAENAMEALADTHLLGRRLVLEFAAGDAVDPEEEIQALERKMGQQTEMVNLSKITGSVRKKFNVEARDGEELI